MISVDPQKIPPWLLAIAATVAVLAVVVQMIRGDSLVCEDGSIFAKT